MNSLPRHIVFFLLVLSFLFGIVFAGLGFPFPAAAIPAGIVFAAVVLSRIKLNIALFAALALFAGSFYYLWDDYWYRAAVARAPSSGEITGTIDSDPRIGALGESFNLKTDYGEVLVQTKSSDRFSYGDIVAADGAIEQPPESYSSAHIVGRMRDPKINKISSGGGNPLIARLLSTKEKIRYSYEQIFPADRAAFLFGVIFGGSDNFSASFSDNLKASGLRFITAIDGLHMQIVIMLIFGALAYFLPRRYAFVLTFLFAFLFVALTGFTVAGIRASFMAFLGKFAGEIGRPHSPENSLAAAALLLTLINPKAPVFDVGFQLSFIAVISIIYFAPVLKKLFRFGSDRGFLEWKEALAITLSVQLATAPIVISQFQAFSLTSFAASLLVVPALPFIIFFGLIVAIASLIYYPLALLIGFAAAPLVDYAIFMVNLFARLAVPFNPSVGFITLAIYYAALIFLIFRF